MRLAEGKNPMKNPSPLADWLESVGVEALL